MVGLKKVARKHKGISEMLAIIIAIALVVAVGIILATVVFPVFTGGSGVTYQLSASGVGSTDGTRAVISIQIQNTGSKPLLVQGVWIAPGGSGAPSSASVQNVQPTSIPSSAVTYSANPPTSRPAAGTLVIQPATSATITIVLTGSNLYRGTPLLVTIYAADQTNTALTSDQSTRFSLS
jgi:predicted PurR-regulated permease PerM